MSYKQGEVWLAQVYFKNLSEYKHRPVVIVGNELTIDIDVLMSPITSSASRDQFDIVIEYWKEAGLRKPSVARTTKIASIPRTALKKKLGELHEHDLHRVIRSCQSLF